MVTKQITLLLPLSQGLTIQDCEDLLEDIKVYVELEQGKNAEFWKDMTIITEDEMAKLKKIDPELQGNHYHHHNSAAEQATTNFLYSLRSWAKDVMMHIHSKISV